MPKLYEINGYQISIWSDEEGEPIHIHISKRKPTKNATKVWLCKDGSLQVAHNKSRIPEHELNAILKKLKFNYVDIKEFWIAYHGYELYYI